MMRGRSSGTIYNAKFGIGILSNGKGNQTNYKGTTYDMSIGETIEGKKVES